MSSTSPWASSATPRACERRCGGAREPPLHGPTPSSSAEGPPHPHRGRLHASSDTSQGTAPSASPHPQRQPGTRGPWGGSPGPPFPRCGRRGPSWAGPGQLPSAGATAGAAQQGPLPSLALPQPHSSSPRCHGRRGEAEDVPGLPGGSPSCPHPPPLQPALSPGCCQLEAQPGGSWDFFLQDSIFFKFIVRLLFGINFNKLMLVPLWRWQCGSLRARGHQHLSSKQGHHGEVENKSITPPRHPRDQVQLSDTSADGIGSSWASLFKIKVLRKGWASRTQATPSPLLFYLKVEKVCLLSAAAGLGAVLISTVWKATGGCACEPGGSGDSSGTYSRTWGLSSWRRR